MRYYISDLHFYHDNLNQRMDCRGFESGEAMNAYMIDRWNSRVRKNDEVIILGDLSVGNAKQTNEILGRLNGTLYLIEGNHDKYLSQPAFYKERFVWIRPYAEMKDNKRKVILSHYPIFCYNGQYRENQDGAPHTCRLYGHVHQAVDEYLIHSCQKQTRECVREVYGKEEKISIPCHLVSCCCMFSDYQPLTLDEWIEVDKKRRDKLELEMDEKRRNKLDTELDGKKETCWI